MATDPADAISLRFKYGTQTVFLFVDPLAPFSTISEELLDALRECYPAGLQVSAELPVIEGLPVPEPPEFTDVPAQGDTYHVAFAAPKNPKDLSTGWKPLKLRGNETPASLKLRENAVLAFVIQTGEDMDAEPTFVVAIPTDEE